MTIRHVSGGEQVRFTADSFNSIIDAANAHRGNLAPKQRVGRQRHAEAGVIWVQNKTGTPQKHLGIVGLTGVAIEPSDPTDSRGTFQFDPIFKAVARDQALHFFRHAILLEPAPLEGDVVRAQTLGVIAIKITKQSANDLYAGIDFAATAAETIFKGGFTGPHQILYSESGTGVKWAVLQLGVGARPFVAKTGSAISAISGSTPGSGTVTVYKLVSGVLETTGVTLTVYNMAGEVAANTFIQCKTDFNGVAYVDVENCA